MLDGTIIEGTQEVNEKLDEALLNATEETFRNLCDSFNTPAVMITISELVSIYNSEDRLTISSEITRKFASWITSMVNTFGLNGEASPDDKVIGWSGIGVPEEAKPYVIPLSKLRDGLRQKARSASGLNIDELRQLSKTATKNSETEKASSNPYAEVLQNFQSRVDSTKDSPSLSTDILHLCDQIRDVDLWSLGIYLEDREAPHPALIRPITKELRAARHEREERERQKQHARLDRDREAATKAEKGRLSHRDMFRTEEYTAWDGEGLPLRDREGQEVTKSKGKKLRKEWERQRKLHEAWVEGGGDGS